MSGKKPPENHPFKAGKWPGKLARAMVGRLNRKFTEDERKREHWLQLGPGFYFRERLIHQ